MAKGQFLNRHGFADTAAFRIVMKKYSDIFEACGFVKHWSNFDWSTVNKPGAPQNSAASEVWRMDDALQATKPVFIKIWYGSSESYDYLFSIWIQVSNGVDGSGNLNGTVIGRQRRIQAFTTSYWDSVDWSNIWSGGESNRLFMMINFTSDWLGVGQVSGGFAIERLRNADGSVNGDGVATFFWHYSHSSNDGMGYESNQVLDFVDVIPHVMNSRVAAMNVLNYNLDATFYNGIVSTIPVYPCKAGALLYNPMLTMLGCLDRDFVNDITTKITHYGVERTYLKIGYGGEFFKWNCNDQNQRARTRGLILWE